MKTVKDILEQSGGELVTVEASSSVYAAVALMAEKEIGALIVQDNSSRVAGIITERDYARKIVLVDRASRTTEVGEIMTRNVVVVEESTPLDQCIQLMSFKNIRHLPVVRQSHPVGMVTVSNLMKSVIEEQTLTIEQLESFIFDEQGGEG